MIARLALLEIERLLADFPAVLLLGPRQVGKTTLARSIAGRTAGPTLFLDLERDAERAMLGEPQLVLPRWRDHLLILDEVQNVPELFKALRPEIDADRRNGRFLLLGSASAGLLRQGAESLAGRIAQVELSPLLSCELVPDLATTRMLWQRGGYPLSYLAASEHQSFRWRQELIRSMLQRDLRDLAPRLATETLRRLMTMLAHLQAQPLNASQVGLALGGSAHSTVNRYVDLLVDALLVRRLEPHVANVGKRLMRSPRLYLRDSGLVHALLGLQDESALHGHPVVGGSWEGFVIEQIAAALPAGAHLGYYRTSAGAEIDAVVDTGGRKMAFEIKFSAAPRLSRGFWQARSDLGVEASFIVAPVERAWPYAEGVDVIPPWMVSAVLGRGSDRRIAGPA